MLLTTLIAAAEAAEEESSKTLFYVMGAVLAAFAVIISAIGIRGHETFPSSQGAARGVMALAVVLVLLTMGAAVVTA
ncbi:MAG TPA: hypothetical protein VFP78_14630 [Solirubrobacteraceae bacterium]|nr:hypothetical protein [Solirubrobacteraceae bacterium]